MGAGSSPRPAKTSSPGSQLTLTEAEIAAILAEREHDDCADLYAEDAAILEADLAAGPVWVVCPGCGGVVQEVGPRICGNCTL